MIEMNRSSTVQCRSHLWASGHFKCDQCNVPLGFNSCSHSTSGTPPMYPSARAWGHGSEKEGRGPTIMELTSGEEMDDPRKQKDRNLCPQGMALSSRPPGTSDSWASDQGSDRIWKEAWKGVWTERLTPAFSEAQQNAPTALVLGPPRLRAAGYPRPPPTSAWPFPLPPAPRKPTAHPEADITINP